MLLEYSVSNFKSFRDETTLSLIASKDTSKNDESVITSKFKETRLLNCAVIYGPNGSGKSNLFFSLFFLSNFVLNSLRNLDNDNQEVNVVPFLLETGKNKTPSSFQVIFEIDGIKYRYGISIDKKKIYQEWLYASFTARESMLFFRDDNETRSEDKFKIGAKFKEAKGLAEKTRPNVPFISVVASLNGKTAKKIVDWFSNLSVLSAHSLSNKTFKILNSPQGDETKEKELIRKIMIKADFGITEVNVSSEKISFEDFIKKPQGKILKDLNLDDPNPEIIIRKEKFGHDVFTKKHDKESTYYFNIEEESEGTKKAYAISGPIVVALKNGSPILIDEMDCSLHSLLIDELIKIFQSKKTNPNHAQLIFTTHNTKYLREKTFRRDQIWLIEKNAYSCSTLFSLFDFDNHVRKDGSWEKDYLFGLYGAIPNVQYLAENICTDYE